MLGSARRFRPAAHRAKRVDQGSDDFFCITPKKYFFVFKNQNAENTFRVLLIHFSVDGYFLLR
jgi:hypothetical protein